MTCGKFFRNFFLVKIVDMNKWLGVGIEPTSDNWLSASRDYDEALASLAVFGNVGEKEGEQEEKSKKCKKDKKKTKKKRKKRPRNTQKLRKGN